MILGGVATIPLAINQAEFGRGIRLERFSFLTEVFE